MQQISALPPAYGTSRRAVAKPSAPCRLSAGLPDDERTGLSPPSSSGRDALPQPDVRSTGPGSVTTATGPPRRRRPVGRRGGRAASAARPSAPSSARRPPSAAPTSRQAGADRDRPRRSETRHTRTPAALPRPAPAPSASSVGGSSGSSCPGGTWGSAAQSPRPGVPPPRPIAVAMRRAVLGPLAELRTDQLRDLHVHQFLSDGPHRLADHIAMLLARHLPNDLQHRSSCPDRPPPASFRRSLENSDDDERRGRRNHSQSPKSRRPNPSAASVKALKTPLRASTRSRTPPIPSDRVLHQP